MKQEKFTVVIPTRERCETLLYTLRTCVDQDYENFEIVVSDNASLDKTREVVESFHDSRIRYVNTGRRVSMSENFDFGLSQVSEGFVMMMGDDDGLFPGAIKRVDSIINKYNVKAVISSSCSYCWPNHPSETSRNIMMWSANADTEIRNTREWLDKMLAFKSFYTFDLPGLYMGFVHLDVIKSMTKGNTFFRSITPDAYSAFACAVVLDSYAYSGRPFSIHGASGRSNGASYWHGSDKKEADLFLEENTLTFHPALKDCPSYRVIAAEAFLQLKEAFPEKTSQYAFDTKTLLSAALEEATAANEERVRTAINEMAVLHGIDMKAIQPPKIDFKERIFKIIRAIAKVRRFAFKYCSIDDTLSFDIKNIHDAARVANVFLDMNDGVYGKKYYRSLLDKLSI